MDGLATAVANLTNLRQVSQNLRAIESRPRRVCFAADEAVKLGEISYRCYLKDFHRLLSFVSALKKAGLPVKQNSRRGREDINVSQTFIVATVAWHTTPSERGTTRTITRHAQKYIKGLAWRRRGSCCELYIWGG